MRKAQVAWVVMLCSFSTAAISLGSDPRGKASEKDIATLKTQDLEILIGNNKSHQYGGVDHRPGYNGVFHLQAFEQTKSPFVPGIAGLNLEHYFDSRSTTEHRETFFEPRYSEMNLRKISETTVELHQPPTREFGVESWTRFSVREPHYLDFSFRCIPRKSKRARDEFLGVFWASYINGPLDKSIYFLDGESTMTNPRWRQFCTQVHNRDSTVRHQDRALDLSFEKPGESLFTSQSPLRYSAPFFYGRFQNMVLIYIFRPPTEELRFAHSPSGGGLNGKTKDTNPAWDFQLIISQPKQDAEYRLEGCLVYKPWVDRADVLREVTAYLESEPSTMIPHQTEK